MRRLPQFKLALVMLGTVCQAVESLEVKLKLTEFRKIWCTWFAKLTLKRRLTTFVGVDQDVQTFETLHSLLQ